MNRTVKATLQGCQLCKACAYVHTKQRFENSCENGDAFASGHFHWPIRLENVTDFARCFSKGLSSGYEIKRVANVDYMT